MEHTSNNIAKFLDSELRLLKSELQRTIQAKNSIFAKIINVESPIAEQTIEDLKTREETLHDEIDLILSEREKQIGIEKKEAENLIDRAAGEAENLIDAGRTEAENLIDAGRTEAENLIDRAAGEAENLTTHANVEIENLKKTA